jgi:PhnB protein
VTEEKPASNQSWGDRMGAVVDSSGHRWSFSNHVEDVSPEEMTRRMQAWAAAQAKANA